VRWGAITVEEIRFVRRTSAPNFTGTTSPFVDEPPSIAQGGRGVVVPGCPTCKKKFGGGSVSDNPTNQELSGDL